MNTLRVVFALLLVFSSAPTLHAQENPFAKLAWQFGPGEGVIGSKAKIQIPPGYAFLNAVETKKFNELTQNISSGEEYVIGPSSLSWFAVFQFNGVGYVKDDEKVDPDAILQAVKRGTEQANEERRKRGWQTMTIQGWRFLPQYDMQTKLLEWAFLATEDGTKQEIINYNTRVLGRTGVMSVILVTSPKLLDQSVGDFKRTLTGYQFLPGEKYAEFRAGDHVAEIGLAALIAGGAAAVATKKGFWAAILAFLGAAWKFIAAAVVGVFVWVGRIFIRKQ